MDSTKRSSQAGLLLVYGSSFLFLQATNCRLTLDISFSLDSHIQTNPIVSSLETDEDSNNMLLSLQLSSWSSLCPYLPIIVPSNTFCLHPLVKKLISSKYAKLYYSSLSILLAPPVLFYNTTPCLYNGYKIL